MVKLQSMAKFAKINSAWKLEKTPTSLVHYKTGKPLKSSKNQKKCQFWKIESLRFCFNVFISTKNDWTTLHVSKRSDNQRQQTEIRVCKIVINRQHYFFCCIYNFILFSQMFRFFHQFTEVFAHSCLKFHHKWKYFRFLSRKSFIVSFQSVQFWGSNRETTRRVFSSSSSCISVKIWF